MPEFSFTPFQSMRREARAVFAHWGKDWFGLKMVKKYPGTVAYATMYTLCYSILTSASFGYKYAAEFKDKDGNQVWSVTSSFLSGGLTGLIMGVVGGQPLVVYGQTGPILLLYTYIFKVSEVLQPAGQESIFPALVAWVGLFSGIMHFLLAIFNTCDLKNKITPFTDNIFACLVAGDFMTTAVMGFAAGFGAGSPGSSPPSIFKDPHNPPANSQDLLAINGFFTLLLGILFYVLTISFGGLQTNCKWSSMRVLRMVSNYAVLWAMVMLVILSYVPQWWPFPAFSEYSDIIPARIPAGDKWFGDGNFWGPGKDYVPFLKMGDVPGAGIGLSVIFAVMLTALFYVDQNISTIFACNGQPWGKVKAPECYNYDFFWLGVTVIITGFMGIPATSGLIPQNPMHTRALALVENAPGREEGEADSPVSFAASLGSDSRKVAFVVEQRVSALIHSFVIFIMIFFMPLISLIPIGLLWGGYLLLASEAVGTPFIQRILGCLSSNSMRSALKDKEGVRDLIDKCDYGTMCKYTGVQFIFWLILYVIGCFLKELAPYDKNHTSNIWVMIGMFFPVITLLYAVPIRTSLLPMFFPLDVLEVLDHEDGEEGEEEEKIPSVAVRSYGGSLRSHRSLRAQSLGSARSGQGGPRSVQSGGRDAALLTGAGADVEVQPSSSWR